MRVISGDFSLNADDILERRSGGDLSLVGVCVCVHLSSNKRARDGNNIRLPPVRWSCFGVNIEMRACSLVLVETVEYDDQSSHSRYSIRWACSRWSA